eukprot:267722-Rhodomonas_salina.1
MPYTHVLRGQIPEKGVGGCRPRQLPLRDQGLDAKQGCVGFAWAVRGRSAAVGCGGGIHQPLL